MKNVFFLTCLLLWSNAQATELYRSIDKDGKVHYGDSPLMDTEDVAQLKLAKDPIPDENLRWRSCPAAWCSTGSKRPSGLRRTCGCWITPGRFVRMP